MFALIFAAHGCSCENRRGDGGLDGGATHGSAPEVEGEPSAGHSRPAVRWSTPEDAVAFRVRLDGGAFEELPLTTTSWASPIDLGPGDHVFDVEARSAEGLWSDPGTFVTRIEYFEQQGYWNGAERAFATTPHDHVCAISAHNCYVTSGTGRADNLVKTVAKIHAAQLGLADLIELDIKDEGGELIVGHDDGVTGGPLLSEVLDDEALGAGDEIMFLELKETAPTIDFARRLLDHLEERRDRYAHNGRPVVIRAFHSWRQSLQHVATALEDERYLFLRPYVRLSVLYDLNQVTDVSAFQDLIYEASQEGFSMIELHFRNPNLHALLAYARSLGLGTNIWTIPVALGEVYVASLREETDVLTVDYPIAKAHDVVEDDTSLVYLNAEAVALSATAVSFYDSVYAPQTAAIGAFDRPSVGIGAPGESLYGGYLRFFRDQGDFLPLVGGDAKEADGVLVSAVVRFRDLTIEDGGTRTIIANTNLGGFTLELHDPAGEAAAVLRFGVYVGSGYVYATYPVASLVSGRSYGLTGAYDGNGGVYVWVDNNNAGVTNGGASGGVAGTNVPITIGADPQTSSPARFFANIDVQLVNVQRWGTH